MLILLNFKYIDNLQHKNYLDKMCLNIFFKSDIFLEKKVSTLIMWNLKLNYKYQNNNSINIIVSHSAIYLFWKADNKQKMR